MAGEQAAKYDYAAGHQTPRASLRANGDREERRALMLGDGEDVEAAHTYSSKGYRLLWQNTPARALVVTPHCGKGAGGGTSDGADDMAGDAIEATGEGVEVKPITEESPAAKPSVVGVEGAAESGAGAAGPKSLPRQGDGDAAENFAVAEETLLESAVVAAECSTRPDEEGAELAVVATEPVAPLGTGEPRGVGAIRGQPPWGRRGTSKRAGDEPPKVGDERATAGATC